MISFDDKAIIRLRFVLPLTAAAAAAVRGELL